MSTTFGIKKNNKIIEIAYRSNGIRFISDLAEYLPDKTKVYALDNTAQGIYTIKDIKDKIRIDNAKK